MDENTTKSIVPISPRCDFDTLLKHICLLNNPEQQPQLTRLPKRPTAKNLRENCDPVASFHDCTAYRNGYAVYRADDTETVVWLPDCALYSYHFSQLEKAELESMPDKSTLQVDYLGKLPWYIAVALRGEDQIERLLMHRKGDRIENRSKMDVDKVQSFVIQKHYNIFGEARLFRAENPEDTFIRRETYFEFMNEKIAPDQKECVLAWIFWGYTYREIAKRLGISLSTVNSYIYNALNGKKQIKRGEQHERDNKKQ